MSETLTRKMLAQNVFDRRWGKDTDQNISVRSLTLLIFAVGWALCGLPQPKHESVMLLLSLSPLNVLTGLLKLYPLSGNIFRKWFASCSLFIYEHLIIM